MSKRLPRRISLLLLPLIAFIATSIGAAVAPAYLLAQPTDTGLRIRSDVQEANIQTGVVTARGNVRIEYPARQLVGTAAMAQFFSNEQKVILSGNVVVIEQGVNTIRAETITYMVNNGQIVAVPTSQQQVESVFVVPDRGLADNPATNASPIQQIKPLFKSPVAPPARP